MGIFVSIFGRQRKEFGNNLECEDYEEKGLITLEQLTEAIRSTDDEVEGKVLDFMIYYVFKRSESAERMKYRTLTSILDERLQAKERAQSAQRKSRPESSSPEKIKARNQGKQVAKQSEPSSSASDDKLLGENNLDLADYSEVEDAAEPDTIEDKIASGVAAAPQP